MAGLFIWNVSVAPGDPRTIRLFLTRGDISTIGPGTKSFIEEVLKSVDLEAVVNDWRITAYRTKYFSEYLGEADWQDNWQIVWRLQIETSIPIGRPPIPALSGVGTEAFDESASSEHRIKADTVVRCMVITNFKNSRSADNASAAVHEAVSRSPAGQRTADILRVNLSKGVEQLQIDLGMFPGTFYAEGADLAEEVMTICKNAGGTVHFQQLP